MPCLYISLSTQSNCEPRHVFAIFLDQDIYCQTHFFMNIPKVEKIETASSPCNKRSGFWAMRNSWVISAVNCQLKFIESLMRSKWINYKVNTYIQKTGLAGWKIPQKIQIFRRKILFERKNYQFCNVLEKRSTGIFEDQSVLKSLAEHVLGFRSYMSLENGGEHTLNYYIYMCSVHFDTSCC